MQCSSALPALKDELKRWKASFLHTHGYKPERSDYLASELRSKFMRFEELEMQRRTQASKSSTTWMLPSMPAGWKTMRRQRFYRMP